MNSIPQDALANNPNIKESFEESLGMLSGLDSIVYGSSSGKISKMQMISLINPQIMNPRISSIFGFKPQANPTLKMVPQNAIFYSWSNTFDAKVTWDEMLKEMERRAAAAGVTDFSPSEALKTSLEKSLGGLNLEKDILPVISNESGIILGDVSLTGPIPIPEFSIFIALKDKNKGAKILDTIFSSNKMTFKSEDYKKVKLNYLSLPLGEVIEPVYCFIDDYLFIGSNRKVVKSIIDSAGSNKSIVKNSKFSALDFGLTKKANSVVFLDTEIFFQKLESIIEVAFSWASLAYSSNLSSVSDYEKYITELESDISARKEDVASIQKEINDLISQGALSDSPEVMDLNKELETAQEDVKFYEQQLESEKENQQLNANSKPSFEPAVARVYLDELVYPIIDGLKEIKAITSRSEIHKDFMDTYLYSLSE